MNVSMNTDYNYLFRQGSGALSAAGNAALGGSMIKMSDLSSRLVQAQLKAAGIDTNSKQYQTVVESMMTTGRGGGYVTVQGIKNRMQYYDANGKHIQQETGNADIAATDKDGAGKNRISSILDRIKDKMFEFSKKESLQENGTTGVPADNPPAGEGDSPVKKPEPGSLVDIQI